MEVSINGARILATFENVPLLGTVHITQTVAVGWVVLILISALCIWLGAGLKVTGISRKQAVSEMLVSSLVDFVHGNMGEDMDQYIPLVGTIFVSSVVSNLISLIGFWSPTADLMTELGWALVVFVLITYHKIKASGIGGYLKGFLDPIFLMAPINVMSELFTPISMACRHFGNILSGTVINGLLYAAVAAASYALFGFLSANLPVGLVFLAAGAVCIFLHKKKGKGRKYLVIGIVCCVLGVLGVLSALPLIGDVLTGFPVLTIGLPAITSFYFDWFTGCIQAFIFCTLTTIFIKQATEA